MKIRGARLTGAGWAVLPGTVLALILSRNAGFWNHALLAEGGWTLGSAAPALLSGLGTLAAVAVNILLLWGAGERLLGWIWEAAAKRGQESPAGGLRACLAFGLGTGAAAQALFLLGLAGVLNAGALLFLTAAALGLAAPEIDGLFSTRSRSGRGVFPAWKGLLGGILAYGAWHAVATALAPPTEWDVLSHHLAVPKLHLAAGAIREIPWLLHSHWPHLMETLYCAPLALGSDAAAALLHAAVCGVFVAAVFFAAREELDGSAAWIAAGLTAAQPALLRLAGTAHSDGGFALFYFLAAWSVWSWVKTGSRAWIALGGVLAGLAASSKLLGAAPALILAGWAASHPSKRGKKALSDALIFAACAACVAGPWYLKTWSGAGNPVWPFLSILFGGDSGAAAIEAPYLASNRWPWPPPASLLFRYGPQYLLGPAICLAAAALLRRGRTAAFPPFVRFLLLQALFYSPLVLGHREAWRFLLPFYPAFALAAAWGAVHAGKRPALKAVAVVLVGAGLFPAVRASQNNRLFPVLGARSLTEPEKNPRDLYLERSLDNYGFYREAYWSLDPDDRVLLFREIRGYYLDADYIWGDPMNQGVIRYTDIRGPKALHARLKELGITHVLVNRGLTMYDPAARGSYYDRRTSGMMEALLQHHARPVLSKDNFTLSLHLLD